MNWTWLDIVIVALGVFQAAGLLWLFLTLLRIRRRAESFARRAFALKDPGLRLGTNVYDRGGRLWGSARNIGLAAAGTYRTVRREPLPGMPVTYGSVLRGLRDGLGTLATLKTVKSFVFREKKLIAPPGPPSVRRRQPRPPFSKKLKDSLVPPILLPVLNQVPNIAFAVGLVRTFLDTLRKLEEKQREEQEAAAPAGGA